MQTGVLGRQSQKQLPATPGCAFFEPFEKPKPPRKQCDACRLNFRVCQLNILEIRHHTSQIVKQPRPFCRYTKFGVGFTDLLQIPPRFHSLNWNVSAETILSFVAPRYRMVKPSVESSRYKYPSDSNGRRNFRDLPTDEKNFALRHKVVYSFQSGKR